MKKHFLKLSAKLFLFAVIAIVSAGSAFAQTGRASEFTAPFDFYVGNQKMSAGTYTVKSLSKGAVMIRGGAKKVKSVIVPVLTKTDANSEAHGERIVFNRYGNQYFLNQFFSQSSIGHTLFESRAEKEIKKSNDVARSVAAKESEKVMIAVKSL